jgi:hypothetical protein
MFLGERIKSILQQSFVLVGFLAGSSTLALASDESEIRRQGARSFLARTEIGVGYQLWNERLELRQGAVSGSGFGHYSGANFILERNWFRGVLQYGGSLGMGAGKATAQVSGVSFPDGGNRDWYSASFSPFAHYRLNQNVMLGLGMLFRYRSIDWTPQDTSIVLSAPSRLQYAGQIHLRWTMAPLASLIQSYTPLGFKGESMWQWSIQAIF